MPLKQNNAISHRANALQTNNKEVHHNHQRTSDRHRRHVETPAVFTGSGPERKTRKRRSADKVGASLVSPTICTKCLFSCIIEDELFTIIFGGLWLYFLVYSYFNYW